MCRTFCLTYRWEGCRWGASTHFRFKLIFGYSHRRLTHVANSPRRSSHQPCPTQQERKYSYVLGLLLCCPRSALSLRLAAASRVGSMSSPARAIASTRPDLTLMFSFADPSLMILSCQATYG